MLEPINLQKGTFNLLWKRLNLILQPLCDPHTQTAVYSYFSPKMVDSTVWTEGASPALSVQSSAPWLPLRSLVLLAI